MSSAVTVSSEKLAQHCHSSVYPLLGSIRIVVEERIHTMENAFHGMENVICHARMKRSPFEDFALNRVVGLVIGAAGRDQDLGITWD